MTNGTLSQNFSAKSSSENGCSISRTRAVDPSAACGYAKKSLSLLLLQQTTRMAARADPSLPRRDLRLDHNLFIEAAAAYEDRLPRVVVVSLALLSVFSLGAADLLWAARGNATLEHPLSPEIFVVRFSSSRVFHLLRQRAHADAMLRLSDFQADRTLG